MAILLAENRQTAGPRRVAALILAAIFPEAREYFAEGLAPRGVGLGEGYIDKNRQVQVAVRKLTRLMTARIFSSNCARN